jgi:hypothetical protein
LGEASPIQRIYAYLVHLKKGEEDRSQPFYSKSESDCDIDITFRSTSDGRQQNDCQDLVLAYLAAPSLSTGQVVAERLGATTDLRSALGLMFLIVGKEGKDAKSSLHSEYAIAPTCQTPMNAMCECSLHEGACRTAELVVRHSPSGWRSLDGSIYC